MSGIVDCGWLQPNAVVISGAGTRRGAWGRVLCGGGGSDLGENQALVCWDVWIPGRRSKQGWVAGHYAAGSCRFNATAPCQGQSQAAGTSVESVGGLINPDDLNITSNGLVFR